MIEKQAKNESRRMKFSELRRVIGESRVVVSAPHPDCPALMATGEFNVDSDAYDGLEVRCVRLSSGGMIFVDLDRPEEE